MFRTDGAVFRHFLPASAYNRVVTSFPWTKQRWGYSWRIPPTSGRQTSPSWPSSSSQNLRRGSVALSHIRPGLTLECRRAVRRRWSRRCVWRCECWRCRWWGRRGHSLAWIGSSAQWSVWSASWRKYCSCNPPRWSSEGPWPGTWSAHSGSPLDAWPAPQPGLRAPCLLFAFLGTTKKSLLFTATVLVLLAYFLFLFFLLWYGCSNNSGRLRDARGVL